MDAKQCMIVDLKIKVEWRALYFDFFENPFTFVVIYVMGGCPIANDCEG